MRDYKEASKVWQEKYFRLNRVFVDALRDIENLASRDQEIIRIRDKMHEFADAYTEPLRNAVQEWGRERSLYCSSGWHKDTRVWQFDFGSMLSVEIYELGDTARINTVSIRTVSLTPKRLKAEMTKV